MGGNRNIAEKKKTQQIIIQSLEDQAKEFKVKLKQIRAAKNDIIEKQKDIEIVFNVRDAEKRELKDVLAEQCHHGRAREEEIEDLKNIQVDMLAQFEREKEKLFGCKDKKIEAE